MRITISKMIERGFRVEATKEHVDIYPDHGIDIADKLQKLTDLPIRDCYVLQEDIVDMQIVHAMKTSG